MMNGLALLLLVTSIGTGFFSPRAEKNSNNNKREDLIVKEANRVILVEYETEARPRDILSPPPPPSEDKLSMESDVIDSTKKKFKEASSVLPNLGQGVSYDSSPSNDHQHHYNVKELICDAYGKCKHKLAGVFGKAKEAAVDKVHDIEDVGGTAIGKTKEAYDKAKENMEGAEEKTKEAVGKAEESVFETGQTAIGKAKQGWGKSKETGDMTMQVSKQGLTKAGEGVSDLAHQAIEIKKNAAKKVLKTTGVSEENLANAEGVSKLAHEVIEKPLEVGKVVIRKTKEAVGKVNKESVSEKGKEFKESVAEKVHDFEETGEKAVEKTKECVGKAKETMYEIGEMAMDRTTEGFAKAGESVREKAQEVKERTKEAEEKAREDMWYIGEVVKKGHNSIVDERSIQTKADGLFKEGCMNFSILYGRGREALFEAAKHAVAHEVVYPALGVLHLLGLATAYGLSVWITFVSSYVLAGTLPRQQFGIVQSKIYPVYFKALLGSIGCSLLAHALRHPHWGLNSFQAHNMLACLALVLINLLYLEPQATKVMFDKMKLEKEEGRGTTAELHQIGEPTASTTAGIAETGVTGITETGVAGEPSAGRVGVAGEPSAGRVEVPEEVTTQLRELNRRLKKLNTISSLLNVVTLMSVTWQLVHLGRGLSVT